MICQMHDRKNIQRFYSFGRTSLVYLRDTKQWPISSRWAKGIILIYTGKAIVSGPCLSISLRLLAQIAKPLKTKLNTQNKYKCIIRAQILLSQEQNILFVATFESLTSALRRLKNMC